MGSLVDRRTLAWYASAGADGKLGVMIGRWGVRWMRSVKEDAEL
jgi:hypothetical protein